MSAPPGSARHSSTTARPAEKGAIRAVLDPALVRKAVSGVVDLARAAGMPMRRSEARSLVMRFETPAELEAYLRTTFRMDPTGVTAVRNVKRERGY